MQSPPLPRRSLGTALALLAWILAACSGGEPRPKLPPISPPSESGVASELRSFLPDPVASAPVAVSPAAAEEIRRLHGELLMARAAEEALEGAASLLEEWPGLAPAQLLKAQALMVQERISEVVDGLLPLVAEVPEYRAAQLLLGRAAEESGELLTAVEAYGAAGFSVALERRAELEPRALEILSNRLADAVEREREDLAREALAKLQEWAPEDPRTVEGAWQVAALSGDPVAELEALAALTALRPTEQSLRLRQAELEVSVGRPRRAVEILHKLLADDPGNLHLEDRLNSAELRLRVALLPRDVQDLVKKAQLERGDYAVLLYWMLPGMRSGRGERPRIAADILEHPQQEKLARIINLGLMDVDDTLHHFFPDRPLSRRAALQALLRFLHRQSAAACMGDSSVPPGPSLRWTCGNAARCRLIREEPDCLPQATVSGEEALEMIRQALRQGEGVQLREASASR